MCMLLFFVNVSVLIKRLEGMRVEKRPPEKGTPADQLHLLMLILCSSASIVYRNRELGWAALNGHQRPEAGTMLLGWAGLSFSLLL
jgi:hypothetical protein